MGTHPLTDLRARREYLLDSVETQGKTHLLKLDAHAVLLEIFEMRDAAVTQAKALESIAASLLKIANPMMAATQELQPDLLKPAPR